MTLGNVKLETVQIGLTKEKEKKRKEKNSFKKGEFISCF
jgi:hypothetical protein